MAEVITAANFFDGMSLHGPSRVTCVDGSIASIESHDGVADHHLLSPGLFDLQMNGLGSVDVARADPDEMVEIDSALLRAGTTNWLATIVTAPLDKLSERVMRLNEVMVSGRCPGMRGIHIEGPFLGGAPGAHRPDWIVPIDMEWLDALPDSVRMVTIAAEQPGVSEAVRSLVSRGIVVSIGHSRPASDDVDRMVEAGATMVTHLFNGMSGVHHRDYGLALAALTEDRLRAGLIADLVHVSPLAISLAFRAKSATGVCLVSDTIAWDSTRAIAAGVGIVDGAPRLRDGTLAGSATPLSGAVRNCAHACAVPVEHALTAATMSPAKLLGETSTVAIKQGSPANLVAFDESLCVSGVWRGLVSHRA